MNGTPATGIEPGFVIILEYTVEGPEQQRQLVEGLAALGKRWVRFHPGFLSARFHISTDGTRVVNFVNWASEEDYRNFLANSDTEGRIAAIEEVLANVSGNVSSPLDSANPTIPGFTVYRTVEPSPQEVEA